MTGNHTMNAWVSNNTLHLVVWQYVWSDRISVILETEFCCHSEVSTRPMCFRRGSRDKLNIKCNLYDPEYFEQIVYPWLGGLVSAWLYRIVITVKRRYRSKSYPRVSTREYIPENLDPLKLILINLKERRVETT